MTRVDFHSKVPDKVQYACRLVRKARAAEARTRYQRRNARLARLTPVAQKRSPKTENGGTQTAVARALQRARARIARRSAGVRSSWPVRCSNE